MLTKEDIEKAMKKATIGHRGKWEVVDGQPTSKVLAREFHGNYSCLIEAIESWEKEFGRSAMLPIEEVTIENQCGYIFKGSTNQLKYIDEYDYQQSDCA